MDSELANAQRIAAFSDYQNLFQLCQKIHYGDNDLTIPLKPCYGKLVNGLFSGRLMTTRSKVYDNSGTIIILYNSMKLVGYIKYQFTFISIYCSAGISLKKD
jgi:hypothetical protein